MHLTSATRRIFLSHGGAQRPWSANLDLSYRERGGLSGIGLLFSGSRPWGHPDGVGHVSHKPR